MSARSCLVCGAADAETIYHGPIRVGRFGNSSTEPHQVIRCNACGTAFLDNPPDVDYESTAYRDLVDGSALPASYYALHDAEQPAKIALLDLNRIRGNVFADVGCGAGLVLDLVANTAAATIGIEPAKHFHAVLSAHGHRPFSYCSEIPADVRGTVEVATCFSVIEHVSDPVALMKEIHGMLRPGGELVLTTPNANDWLLEILPETYPAFFYRAVHRWYFNESALEAIGRAAGFGSVEIEHMHRFDMANMLLWLRDGRPSGVAALDIGAQLDATFRAWLEETGRSDYLVARFQR